MNRSKCLAKKIGFVLCMALLVALTGHTTYAAEVSVFVGVAIHTESDFYEPLSPYGRWEVVGSYGRCWIPNRVEADWRPYSEGYWQRTDDGWYWVSDEPWGWATYHYGRWNLSAEFGWYWVPQTQWAPAWVSWHSGGGYIGWAPLYPSDVRVISPRAYVFVEERHFMEPVSHSTVVVNNTIIINKTVINEAPRTEVIEKASGRKIQAVQVQELRHKTEAAVVVKHEAKPQAVQLPQPKAKPEFKPETEQPVKREVKPEAERPVKREAPPVVEQPSKREAKPEPERPAKEKQGENDKGGARTDDKGQEKKGNE